MQSGGAGTSRGQLTTDSITSLKLESHPADLRELLVAAVEEAGDGRKTPQAEALLRERENALDLRTAELRQAEAAIQLQGERNHRRWEAEREESDVTEGERRRAKARLNRLRGDGQRVHSCALYSCNVEARWHHASLAAAPHTPRSLPRRAGRGRAGRVDRNGVGAMAAALSPGVRNAARAGGDNDGHRCGLQHCAISGRGRVSCFGQQGPSGQRVGAAQLPQLASAASVGTTHPWGHLTCPRGACISVDRWHRSGSRFEGEVPPGAAAVGARRLRLGFGRGSHMRVTLLDKPPFHSSKKAALSELDIAGQLPQC